MPTTSHRKFKHPSLVAAAAAAVNCLIERKIDPGRRDRHPGRHTAGQLGATLTLVMMPHETASVAQLRKR